MFPRFRVSLHFPVSTLPRFHSPHAETELQHIEVGWVDSEESNPGPLGYGRDIISNRLALIVKN